MIWCIDLISFQKRRLKNELVFLKISVMGNEQDGLHFIMSEYTTKGDNYIPTLFLGIRKGENTFKKARKTIRGYFLSFYAFLSFFFLSRKGKKL